MGEMKSEDVKVELDRTRDEEVILFSAAIPFQGGVKHINEQWPDYWIEKFTARGYVVIDCIREQVWDDESVEWWYSQNIFVFVKHRYLKHFPKLLAEFGKARLLPISIVHPRNYSWRQSRVQT